MQAKLMIILDLDEFTAFQRLAHKNLRTVKDHVRFVLREELIREGLLLVRSPEATLREPTTLLAKSTLEVTSDAD